MNKIEEALTKRFKDNRVIFWYDKNQEFTDLLEEIELPEVQKVIVKNNEFEVKYLICKKHPDSKFLLYFDNEKPANEENWLLDIELAHHVFQTDQESMFLQEMGLGYHLKELVTEHLEFFRAKERRQALKDLFGEGDEHQEIRYKILAVLFGTENVSLVTYIHCHATAYADGNDRFDRDLERFNIKNFYWKEIARKYKYSSSNPTIYDFLMEVFTSNFCLNPGNGLAKESKLLLSTWRDTIQYRQSYGKISEKVSQDTSIETKLAKATVEDVVNDELFKLTDKKIIHDMIGYIVNDEIPLEKVLQFTKIRENKFWYNELESIYQCIDWGSETLELIKKFSGKKYASFEDGVNEYSETLYQVEYAYRKFIWNFRKSNQSKLLSELEKKVETVYSNTWLLEHNNKWQKVIDAMEFWPTNAINSQKRFFEQHVKPVISKKQRLFVIITDAFRYECGMELSKRLLSENRYDSSIESMTACLPTYTQLGMASLLPHKDLSFQENSENIVVDGISSSGVQGRAKILAENSGVRATAIQAEDFMKLNAKTDGRDFVKEHDLIYIYNNRIDKAGDDKTTEERVFEAVEDEIQFLMELLRKIANMNGNNMIITSDHGFLYQHNELEESDYSQSAHQGEVWKESRRYVIGKNLTNDSSTRAFKANCLSLASEVDILIPKSINRLRIKGAGARFIHGGASLQEVVIPLVKVNKKRQDTTTNVEVDIIKSTDRITTNILAVSFIQSDLVSEQVLARTIKSAIYAEDGELISDQFKYVFDISEGSERQREVKHRFQLSSKASGKYKNQRVKLVLEEPVEGSSRWKLYKEYFYTLNISFTNDFDE